ncbi:hypothetical protein ACFLXY_00520 [Chloroflexota bacterium]
MKRLIITGLILMLSATLLLPMLGCNGETEEAEPVASESNRWLEMLKILPENEVTLTGAVIQTEGYVDIITKEYSEKLEDSPVSPELIAHNNIPLFARGAYSDEEWKETVGFTINDVTESIMASAGPPDEYQAIRGNFTAEEIRYAAMNGPLNEHLEVKQYGEYEYYSWGEDRGIHLEWRSNVRNLGRGHRLAYVDGFALWMLWTDGLEEMIDAYEGTIPSLADNEDYKLLAVELEKMNTDTALFSARPTSISEFREMFSENLDELEQKGNDEQLEAFENEPLLKPFLSFATGAGQDERGSYMVIILLNEDEKTAKENASLLERRLNESIMYPYISNPADGSKKWTDDEAIEVMEVDHNGRFTTVKLYGRVFISWDGLSRLGIRGGPYLPLLLHE